jgi:hypothetical protein
MGLRAEGIDAYAFSCVDHGKFSGHGQHTTLINVSQGGDTIRLIITLEAVSMKA